MFAEGPLTSPLTGRTGDIGEHGLLLHLPVVLPIGTEITLTLQASGGPVHLEGEVAWVEPSRSSSPGATVHHGFRLFQATGPDWGALAPMLDADLP